MNASDLTSHDLHVSGGIFTSDNATIFGNTSTATLTCDLTPNLTAGTGITITSVGGKPTITATGGGSGTVPDPLNLSQLNASNISVDANTSVGFDLSVGNDATITRDLQVQRYLDAGKPTFIMLRRTANTTLTGGQQFAIFNSNTTAQINGEFSTATGSAVIVATGGWYRVSWGLGFLRTSNTGGDRIAIRGYTMKATAGGSLSFDSSKNVIGSSCYIRRNNMCREGHITGYNFLYIPAGGAVSIRIECMVEGASSWSSSFTGMQLRGSSNLMVEFVSSAAET
tara:strand:- start:205 stop:1053 length:849 start_codon:yes stop_codon:yes gene_type:complete